MRKRLIWVMKLYTSQESVILYLALSYKLLFTVLVQYLLPQVVSEQVIYQVGTLLATVEGIFIALSPQIRIKSIRDWVAVGLGVPALMVPVITVTIAYYQSIQLGYLSTATETFL